MPADLLAPESRHNRYVTTAEDVAPVGDWSREALFAAVEAAADRGDGWVVVIDYGRDALYLAHAEGLRYDPPRALGVAAPPALHVRDPLRYDPAAGHTVPVGPTDDAVRGARKSSVVGGSDAKRRPDGTDGTASNGPPSDGQPLDGTASKGPTPDGPRIPGDAGRRVAGDGRGRPEAGENPTVVTVSPEFDVLIPAFDWEELSEDDLLPPVESDESPSSAGVGSGTPN